MPGSSPFSWRSRKAARFPFYSGCQADFFLGIGLFELLGERTGKDKYIFFSYRGCQQAMERTARCIVERIPGNGCQQADL